MMDTDAVLRGLVTTVVVVLAAGGVVHLALDFRHYSELYKQCKEQGFVQNQTTRITCKVE